MTTKIGRNDPCSCGSGKKYKKCCLGKQQTGTFHKVPTEVLDFFRKQEMERKHLHNLGIYLNFVKPVIFKGKKVWALGSRVYPTRPPSETFHEFTFFVLQQTLGFTWWQKQSSLLDEEKHFIMYCYGKYGEWRKKNATQKHKVGGLWAARPDGWTRALLSLAFDVFSILHADHLPDQLLKRLRNKDQYQGARYEIVVAAIFARLGYKIKFLDEDTEIEGKRCEFIAYNNSTGDQMAVEVKSKEREGVTYKR